MLLLWSLWPLEKNLLALQVDQNVWWRKNSYSRSSLSAGTFDLADQEPDTTSLISIDHPPNTLVDQSRDKFAHIDNLLEVSRTQFQISEEKFSANQIKESPNVAQSIQILVQDHLKAVQEIKESYGVETTPKQPYKKWFIPKKHALNVQPANTYLYPERRPHDTSKLPIPKTVAKLNSPG